MIVPLLVDALPTRGVVIDYGDHIADKRRRIDETVEAMRNKAPIIVGGQLPDNHADGRTGAPDVLYRVTPFGEHAEYVPVDIKHHTTLQRAKQGKAQVSDLRRTTKAKNGDADAASAIYNEGPATAHGWTHMTSHRRDDAMQLAHYIRMLEAIGRRDKARVPVGGIIGTSDFSQITGERYGIVWYDLTAPTEKTRSNTSERGWTKRSVLDVYDHEFAFRQKVAATARDGGPALVEPFGKAECMQCPYEDWCTGAAGDRDASFAITVGRLSDREWRYLYDNGLHTIDALAQARATGPLLDGFQRQAAHLPTPERRLETAIRRARMVRDDVLLERTTPGVLPVPEADVEIDFDVEWHPADGHVYQWGARVRRAQDEATATYEHSVLSFDPLDDAAAQVLADDFFDWLERFVEEHEDAGRSVRIFHWTSPEVTRTVRALGGERAEALFERFLDLREWMDQHYFARDGLSLKVVAPIFNFKWRAEDAGGETSTRKIEEARDTANAQASQDARAWLLDYNEDDCSAQAAIRDGLRRVADLEQITSNNRPPLVDATEAGPVMSASTSGTVHHATQAPRTADQPIPNPEPATAPPNSTSPSSTTAPQQPRKLPMPAAKALSLNEIRTRVDAFVSEWRDETSENSEAQTFWNEFLHCFGINRRRVATFEKWATRASTGGKGRIDVFWPSVLIAEHKSAGAMKEDSAEQQATDYLVGGDIKANEYPRYIITSDFQTIRLTDLDAQPGEQTLTVPLADLSKHVDDFAWIAGYQARKFSTEEEAAASVKAANLMANLYVALTSDANEDIVKDEDDESDQSLSVSIMLTRLLFLMFGDDAGLWEKGLFNDFLITRTEPDGSDLGSQLNALFDVLNTPERRRSDKADASMLAFPYVNGALFAGREATQFFDSAMRDALLEASAFDWTAISPAVFGSLFQAIKSKVARRADGEHYTTETNILKTLEPLFLDEIRDDLRKAWNSAKRLRDLHATFAAKRYLDPACGCGNFLIVAYREMRKIELDLLIRLRQLEGDEAAMTLDGTWDLKVSLDQFYGIELNWWPAKIAETAMFLVDHQANREMALALGQAPDRLPIKITAHIHHGNALTTDWSTVLAPTNDTIIFGNPPFLGHATRNDEQAAELRAAWKRDDISRLDFVTGWHAKTLDYLQGRRGVWAFVTTNSITQGDPVPSLFRPVFDAGWHIKFAHRTFAWSSEATGKAAVHCVIVGFTRDTKTKPRLFDYATSKSDPHEVAVNRVNAYLVDGPEVFIEKRSTPLSDALPLAVFGAMARDGGNLIVEPADYAEVMADPVAAKYVRPFIQADELIHNRPRWCLWLTALDPNDVSRSPVLKARLDAVADMRSKSRAASTRAMAATPGLFGQRPPEHHKPYLCIPRHVSETRRYFTAARFDHNVISGDANFTAEDPDGFLFAIISSSMFMAWQRTVGGRLESRLRFSNTIVWNNLPLPPVDEKTRTKIIRAGEAVLAARALHPDRSLAEHYNPLAMDPALIAAHNKLDALVDRAFGATKTCANERDRQAILFARHNELTNPLGTVISGVRG